MAIELLGGSEGFNLDEGMEHFIAPINGTDSRRRLEDKLEEMRLRRELKEFDFDGE